MSTVIIDESIPDMTFLNDYQDYIESRPIEHLGELDMTFEGRLSEPGLQIYEDGGELGCGGKVWVAGELLSKYLLDKGLYNKKKVVEIGSGTGLVGLALGLSEKKDQDMGIWITDIDDLVPLMDKNIKLNGLEEKVFARSLSWGDELPEFAKDGVDVILAADCVYLEKAFPLLEKTLIDLTTKDTLVLMSYKKRRKADMKFFRKIKKNFDVVEITDFNTYEIYSKQNVHLFQMIKKT